jgi:hypothetical protein
MKTSIEVDAEVWKAARVKAIGLGEPLGGIVARLIRHWADGTAPMMLRSHDPEAHQKLPGVLLERDRLRDRVSCLEKELEHAVLLDKALYEAASTKAKAAGRTLDEQVTAGLLSWVG